MRRGRYRIANSGGTLAVANSTFSTNSGGAISNSGAGTLTVTNSTFSGNSGGAIGNAGTELEAGFVGYVNGASR